MLERLERWWYAPEAEVADEVLSLSPEAERWLRIYANDWQQMRSDAKHPVFVNQPGQRTALDLMLRYEAAKRQHWKREMLHLVHDLSRIALVIAAVFALPGLIYVLDRDTLQGIVRLVQAIF